MARFNLGKLKTRAISALVLALLTLLIVIYDGLPFAALLALLAAISLYEWFNLARKTPRSALWAGFGFVYIVGSFVCAYLIRETHFLSLSLMFLCMIWASDIGAYFAGKIIGGPKMSPTISPNKTWAGLGGAMFSPALVALLWMGVSDALEKNPAVEEGLALLPYIWIFLGGALIGLIGQLGDLLISFVKRQAGVKDSGHLIPGHGGLLDRIDSLLLAAPVYLVLAGAVFDVP